MLPQVKSKKIKQLTCANFYKLYLESSKSKSNFKTFGINVNVINKKQYVHGKKALYMQAIHQWIRQWIIKIYKCFNLNRDEYPYHKSAGDKCNHKNSS